MMMTFTNSRFLNIALPLILCVFLPVLASALLVNRNGGRTGIVTVNLDNDQLGFSESSESDNGTFVPIVYWHGMGKSIFYVTSVLIHLKIIR